MAEASEFLMIVTVTVLIGLALLTSLVFALGAIILAGRVMFHYLTRETNENAR